MKITRLNLESNDYEVGKIMDDNGIERLAQIYVKIAEAKTQEDRNRISDKDLDEDLYKLDKIRFESPKELWKIILRVHELTDDPEALSFLAADILEDLLAQFPYQSIEWVEEQAKNDPRFRKLIYGVWQNYMPDDVWERLQKLKG